MRFEPERTGGGRRINASLLPPCLLIAMAMDLAMMAPAEWYDEFIASFPPKRPVLCKAQVMRIGGACDRKSGMAVW
jgi:hypothetical protein